jgi:membrane-bound metal-dependent hydrolase YbcI (DUF457 family)
MAQAGIHGLVGMAVRKLFPARTWLMLGILLGSLLPDADNLLVAMATVMKRSTEGLHRTFSHSLFFAVALLAIFWLVGQVTRQVRWTNLGFGLAVGVVLHSALDILIWFNGVEILWPLPSWINLWAWFTVPAWFDKLMLSAEFLFFALFFYGLDWFARARGTDNGYLKTLRVWTIVQAVFFILFTVLVYVMSMGFMTIYGAVYLLSLFLAIGITIRMRQTVEAI